MWRQPLVFALDNWLRNCWDELVDAAHPALIAPARSVIDSHGELLLWRSSIAQDTQLPEGADIASLAELAMTTGQQLQRCAVPLNELNDSHHPGTDSLLRWLNSFNSALESKKLLTWEQAQGLVAQAFKEGGFPAYPAIRLVGFQTLTALHRGIVAAASADVAPVKHTTTHAALTLQNCRDDQDEITAAAQWAKAEHARNPLQRIGVVFGNLAKSQQQVSRIFHDTFLPEHCLPNSERAIPPFNFSAGSPLGKTPLVASALSLLAVQTAPQPLDQWCQLLGDPFWGATPVANGQAVDANSPTTSADSDDRIEDDTPLSWHHRQLITRANCELLLRDNNKLVYKPGEFRASLAEAELRSNAGHTPTENAAEHAAAISTNANTTAAPTNPSDQAPSLARAWQDNAEQVRRQANTASYCHWADEFTQRLNTLGWPGSRSLDSIEYQQHQHWLSLLEEFAALDHCAAPLSAHGALTQLTRMAKATPFQAQTNDSQVQILGLLEAAGLQFDQLWITGMDDRQWPQPTALNPLLPVAVQQQYQLPRSSASQELTLARQLIEDFQHSSQAIIFSYASRDGDSEREVSRLINPASVVATSIAPDLRQPLLKSLPCAKLQTIEIANGPPLHVGDQAVRGGTAILQAQSGSPFNAFATWRLGAQALAEPSSGLSAMERGNLVHKCLELFWLRFNDQASVKALDSAALDSALEQVIAEAMRPLHQSRSDIFGPRFAAIESQRLKQLLQQWLAIELKRSNFTVLAPEKELLMTIGGLPLKLRIDRIDRLDDQRVVLIDYKTGDTNINCWAGERIEQPQLPLYALGLPEHIAALCFGQISTTKSVTAKGVSDTPEIIPGLQPLDKINYEGWEDCLDEWREQLETLAAEFLAGQAEVAFYNSDALRYQSHLYPLNRWPEISQRDNAAIEMLADMD